MSTTALVQLAVGVPAQMRPPNQAQLVAAIAVQNQSGYDLTVSIGGGQFNLAPYTQDLYPTAQAIGTPIALLPVNNSNSPANVPAYAVATWFGPDELPDPGAYPAGLTAPPYAIGLQVAQQLLASGVPIAYSTKSLLATQTVFDGGSVGPLDTSTMQTVAITAVPAAAIVGTRCILDLSWQSADGFWQYDEMVSFHSLTSYSQTYTGISFLVPVKGPQLTIAAQVGSGSSTTLAVSATNRANGAAVSRKATIPANRWLLDTGNQAIIAGGASQQFYIPPVAKRVRIASNMTATTQLVTLDAIRSAGSGPVVSRSIDLIGGGGWPGMLDIWMPNTGLELTMRNTSAGTLTWSAQAWDVSD